MPKIVAPTAEKMTPAHSGAVLRWLSTMASSDQWGLSTYEMATLTETSPAELQAWLECAQRYEHVVLPVNVLERVGLLLSIYQGIDSIAPIEPDVAARWFSKPIAAAPFQGLSIKQYLLGQCDKNAAISVLAFLQGNPYL